MLTHARDSSGIADPPATTSRNGQHAHVGPATSAARTRHSLEWNVGPHAKIDVKPSSLIPAKVPGAVQLDWAAHEHQPPYWKGENFRTYRWIEDMFWTYEAKLDFTTLLDGARLFFVCEGIDYRFIVKLNGETLHTQEGMFTPVEIELTGKTSSGDTLTITVFPAPKSQAAHGSAATEHKNQADTWFAWDTLPTDNHTQANFSCKPAVSFGWDFHPRLIPLGIWKAAYLEVRPPAFLGKVSLDYNLGIDLETADLVLHAETDGPHDRTSGLRWTLLDPEGKVVFKEDGIFSETRRTIRRPALWWPHDHGAQPLYTSCVELLGNHGQVLDARRTRTGFRRARLVMAPGQWDWPMPSPTINQRSRPPMTFEINGRTVFAKGANWVSPEIFPGLLGADTYAAQLACVRGAHMNMLRLWGGAPVQKDEFYQQCDELGIMVWQDFPLSCNCYPDAPDYLRVLDQESRSIIAAIREHPSLVCWCGGNELFNSWSRMTDQSLPLRLLQSNCYQLDPSTPYLHTTPLEGVGHGSYVFRDPKTGVEAWAMFQQASYTAYCEFGCPGPAVLEAFREIIPEDELFPPRADGAWKAHHAFEAWMKTSHLYPDVLEHYFGPTENLEQLTERGHLLQSEGYKGLFEEVRRQKPVANIALCWCLNEPWPTAANNSLISWPTRPKPALAAVGEACRPLLASARVRKFQWDEGETFDPELFWLNDAAACPEPGPVHARIETPDGHVWPLTVWHGGPLADNANLAGPKLNWKLPNLGSPRFDLVLDALGQPDSSSRYTLLFGKPSRTAD